MACTVYAMYCVRVHVCCAQNANQEIHLTIVVDKKVLRFNVTMGDAPTVDVALQTTLYVMIDDAPTEDVALHTTFYITMGDAPTVEMVQQTTFYVKMGNASNVDILLQT